MKLLIFWAILKRKLNTINSAQQVRKADLVKGLEAKALAVAILADLADSATSLIHFSEAEAPLAIKMLRVRDAIFNTRCA